MGDLLRRLRWHFWAVLLDVTYHLGSRPYLWAVRGLSNATDWGEIPDDGTPLAPTDPDAR